MAGNLFLFVLSEIPYKRLRYKRGALYVPKVTEWLEEKNKQTKNCNWSGCALLLETGEAGRYPGQGVSCI